MSDDYTSDTATMGSVEVGGEASGEIETGNDFDWFAVELVAGRAYVIDIEGATTDGVTLNTVLRGLYDSSGNRIDGTQTNGGGEGEDARLYFTAPESGTYYIAARGFGNETGSYTVRVAERASDDTRAGARELGDGGDITDLDGPRFPKASLDGSGDSVDYFRFTLTEAKTVGLGLRQQDANADLFLEDATGKVIASSTAAGTANERISETLLAGTYYVRVEAQGAGANDFRLRYGVSDPDSDKVAELEAAQEAAANRAPSFAEPSYAFDLAENTDGSETAVALGRVSATDPDEDALTYSIVGGNGDGLFAVDASTGALSYVGAGEDYESGTTSHELTVRASDGALHSDVIVAVSVTDVVEPDISVSDAEAEEADGVMRFRVTLSEATTAPVSVRYQTADGTAVAGDDYTSTSGRLVFAAGETEKLVEVTLFDDDGEDSGETLTLELSDAVGGRLSVASATGTILNDETDDPASPANVSEPGDADLPADTTTTGRVAVGSFVTGEIGTARDQDWFAVELEAGKTYRIDLKGADSGSGTLSFPILRGIHDAGGRYIAGTINYDGGIGNDSRLIFTPAADGTHYIAADTFGNDQGTYELAVTDLSADGEAHADATDLGDITEVDRAEYLDASLGGADRVDYFRFVLGKAREVKLGLRQQDADADLFLEDADGKAIASSTEAGTANERVAETLLAGTYYVRVEAREEGANAFKLRYEAGEPDAVKVAVLEAALKAVTNEAPSFSQASYAFDLAENADGSTDGVALGEVAATDPDEDVLTYSIEGGNEAGLFEIDASTGALSYTGTGEDYESETTGYELTVRASDGSLHSDVTVTVNVTDVEETEVTEQQVSQPQTGVSEPDGTDLPDNATTTGRAAVGEVVTGEIGTSGDRDWFAVELVAGRDYRIDMRGSHTRDGTLRNPYLQDVRDADGELVGLIGGLNQEDGLNSQLTFTPTESGTYYIVASGARGGTGTYELEVTDTSTPNQAPAFAEPSYAFDLAEDADGSTTGVLLGSVSASDPEDGTVTYTIASGNDAGLFAIDASTGALSYTGSGHETGVTGYGLTVRASDGELHSDVTVSIDLTDTDQAPVFARPDYVFELVENAERVVLGTVQATDQEGEPVTYSIALGNDAGLFAIDSSTGALSYSGPGEDFEADMPSYALTVRASDGSLHSDVVVTVNVTDVWEPSAPDPDDFAADTSTTGRVTVGAETTGKVERSGDIDWFAVTLQAGRTYQIDLLGVEASSEAKAGSPTRYGTLGDTEIHGIHDAEGNLIPGTMNGDYAHEDFGSTDNSRVMFTPTESATYFVAAGASPTTHTDTGTYTVIVTDVTDDVTDDYAAGTATTGTVTVGSSVEGSANFAVDRDWFAVTLEGGQTYRFDLEGKDSGAWTLVDPALHGIYDADGNLADNTTSDDGGIGENSRVLFTPTVNGTYYVVAGASDYAGSDDDALGTYRLSVTDVTDTLDDDYTAGTNTTGTVAVGASVEGEVEVARDRDWFAVALEAGKTYRIDVKGADSGLGSLEDPYLHGIHDADGKLILSTDADDGGNGRDSRVKFRPTEDGTYYIAAGGNDNDEHTGTYRVAVQEVANPNTDDYSAGTDTTGEVEVGGSATGELDLSSDHDWFKVALEAGRTYRFDLGREDLSAGYWYPGLLGLHDSDGNLIAGTGDANALAEFTATEDGSHFVVVGSSFSTGAYRLSVEDITDDFAAGTDTTGKVAVGGLVKGNIEVAGDRDWIAVDLEAGKTYQIDLKGSWTDTDAGAIYDPYVHGLYNADGQLIAGTVDDDSGPGSDSRVSVAVTQSGTYYVAVGSHPGFEDDTSRGEGSYALMVSDLGVENAPRFPETGYAFDLAENRDGSVNRITVGRISAADPEEAVLTYSIVAGNDANLFEIRSATHDSRSWLYYVGSGEDYESDPTSRELTVRASDGTLHTDVSVVVNITDVVEDAL